MARSASSRPRKRSQRSGNSPSMRPSTRSTIARQRLADASSSPSSEALEPSVHDGALNGQPAQEIQAGFSPVQARMSSASTHNTTSPPMETISCPDTRRELPFTRTPSISSAAMEASSPPSALSSASSQAGTIPGVAPAPRAPQKRDGTTKIYLNGHEYTRANTSSVKITYRCSFYRKPKFCPGQLVLYASTMTYDIANMIPHTCHLGQEDAQLNDDSALINVEDEMREFVDELADQDIPGNQIWMLAYTKFYAASTCVVRGLSRSQVIKRNGNAKADTKMFSLVETPDLAKVKNEIVGFLQFNYAWNDDSRAKQGKSGIERLIGWSHPELRNLLRYDGLHLFVDGTFRCTPKSFHQFVTLMMYDPLTDLFVPVFFTLTTNKTTDLYTKMFKCIEFALGKEPNPADVVCDFEAAMISAIDYRFPSTRIVGCLFHFKQACRRKMKEYRLSEAEAGVAMEFGVLDMLTVIHPQKIALQGVAWVKTKIKERCAAKGLEYSRNKWKRFWQYFTNTWLVTYPPELWNIYGVQRKIVNRANNPLERFHRELNARMKAHPTLKRFVRVIEEIAREYVVLRRSIISGDATAPVRSNLRFPRSAVLPEPNDIVDSDDDNDDIDAENTGVSEDDVAQLSDDELGMLYDTSFDHEDEMKSDAAALAIWD